jgi:hypothetical protein
MVPLPSPAYLLARQVRLNINPPTSTLFESRAILSEVQSRFGPVSIFINPRNDPALRLLQRSRPPAPLPYHQRILAVFDLSTSKDRALASDPIAIACGGDLLPSARELDPFNARGLHGRYHPPKRTFSCEIADEEDADILGNLAKSNPYAGPFFMDTLEMSYGDLIGCGVPLREMADVMQTVKARTGNWEARRQNGASEGIHLDNSDGIDIQETGGLMNAWRRGIANDNDRDSSSTRSLEENI